MSRRLRNSLHKIADEVSATEANRQAWLAYATTAQKPPALFQKRTVLLAAALIAVIALAGFAYVKSVYFDKIFGEPFSMASPELSDNELQKLLKNLSPGDVLNTEIETADGTVVIKAISGDTLDVVAYGLKGDNTIYSNTFPHDPITTKKDIEERLETIKGLKVDRSNSLEDHIAAGKFVAALDGGDYTLDYILLRDGRTDTLIYKGKSGETIQVVPISGQLSMEEKAQKDAAISDITIDGRVFTVIEHPGKPGQADLYLYIDENLTYSSIALYNYDPRGGINATKEQMLDAARHLVLYNEDANLPMSDAAKDYYNEAFFQKINDPVIRGASKEIAAAIRRAQKDESNPQITVWEKDGRRISVDFFEEELVNSIMLECEKMGYNQALKLITLPEQSPFDLEGWFPADKLQSVIINYYEGRFSSVFWYSEDFASSMNMRYVSDREIGKTPLDTLAISAQFIGNDLIKVVKARDGSPYLISSRARLDGKTNIFVSATKKYGGKTLCYQLCLDESGLPGGSVDKWMDTF